MNTQILKLNKAGTPFDWISFEDAAIAKAKGLVLWSMGGNANTFRGGYQNSGQRSILDIPTIIAVDGRVREKNVPKMTNRLLFARDEYTCLYCVREFPRSQLTRDHIIPASRGGADTWENCCTSCKRCNHAKDDRTPEEAGLELAAVPYAPNLHEWFALSNKNVLADQMEYLRPKFKNLVA